MSKGKRRKKKAMQLDRINKEILAPMRRMAESWYMRMRANKMRCNSSVWVWHVILYDDLDRQILQWWPSNGTWFSPVDRTKGNLIPIIGTGASDL